MASTRVLDMCTRCHRHRLRGQMMRANQRNPASSFWFTKLQSILASGPFRKPLFDLCSPGNSAMVQHFYVLLRRGEEQWQTPVVLD